MKKQNFKLLKLNKKAITSFKTKEIKGRGYSNSNVNVTHENCCYPL